MRGDLDARDQGISPGARFHGHYQVVRRIGEGGMGVVYEVVDHRTARHRALKLLRPDEPPSTELLARFRLEATATAAVRSAHLVEVLDAGVDEDSGRPFLVMELLEGESGEQRLRRVGRLSADEVSACVDAIARALDALHTHGIVHRDLKPQNLFFARDDRGAEVLKLLDFGAVKVLSESLRTTRALGSPLYMSPESLEGDATIDGRADVYALGHVVFTLLVGEAYWERLFRDARGYHAVLVKVLKGGAVDAEARAEELGVRLPRSMNAWFARATARRPGDRFDTAGECAAALAGALRGERVHPARRSRGWALLAGTCVVVASSAIGIVAIASTDRGAEALTASAPSHAPPPAASAASNAGVSALYLPTAPARVVDAARAPSSSVSASFVSLSSSRPPPRTPPVGAATVVAPSASGAPAASAPLRPPADPAKLR